jgi:microcystin-dependent protein
MPVETATYIDDLDASNPPQADGLRGGDDHIRLIKATILATFPNIEGEVEATHTELNTLLDVLTDGAALLDTDGAVFAGDTNTGITHSAADKIGLKAGGTERIEVNTTGITLTGPITSTEGHLVPTGTVLDYAGATEPSGFLFCYGQAVSRTTYAALFTAISTTYGVGDGSTTFNLPDLRGRVVAGQDDMGGSSANRLTAQTGGVEGDTLGAVGGAETHVLTEAQLAAHDHAQTAQQPTFTYSDTGSIDLSGGGGTTIVNSIAASGGETTITPTADASPGDTATAGSDAAHNNVQPTIILNKIIKT